MNFSNQLVVLIGLCALAILLAAASEPLDHMHWDVPIYIYQAKRFAETPYLINYIRHASDIAAQLNGHWPADEAYPEAYWRFGRLGHIAILGMIVHFFGSNFPAIVIMTWLYTAFLIVGLVFILLATVQIGNKAEPQYPWGAAAGLSMLLFLLSDIYRYLAGNLISEVPSLLLGSIAVYSLLKAIETKRLIYAAFSGALAFLAYTMRIESVWLWLTFIFSYIVTCGAGTHPLIPWRAILVAGLTAIACYLSYAIVFSPLAYPTQSIAFFKAVMGAHDSKQEVIAGYKSVFVIGGFLWFGALFSLARVKQSALLRLGWLWLLTCALSLISHIFWNTGQTRMFISLIPPLFLLSASGWAIFIKNGLWRQRHSALIGLLICCLFLLSDLASYQLLNNNIPGIWRLANVRTFLAVPRYERLNYMPQEILLLSQDIYADKPTVLIYTKKEVSQEHINLIRFFGSSYSADSDLALVGDPTNVKKCEEDLPSSNEPVLFCAGYNDSARLKTDMARYRILTLQAKPSLLCPKDGNLYSDTYNPCDLLPQQRQFVTYKETAHFSLLAFSPLL